MTFDLVLLSLVLVFAVWGAMTGAAQQIANVVSLILGWVGARPLGTLVGPGVARKLEVPTSVAIVGTTVLAFLLIVLVARWVITWGIQRMLDGENPESRSVDSWLGFLLGGAKVALVAWLVLCALTFVEDNVSFAGKRLGISPRDSVAFDVASRFNLFELTQFSGAKDLARVASAATDPKKAPKLRQDPAYQRLAKDPRYRKLLADKRFRAALEKQDYRALVKDDAVLQLLHDPKFAEALEVAASSAP